MDTIGKIAGSLPHKTDSRLTAAQLRELERFGCKINKFGVNFAVCNVDGELVLLCDGGKFKSGREQLIGYGLQALKEAGNSVRPGAKLCGEGGCIGREVQVCRFGEANLVLAAVLKGGSEAVGTALIDLGDKSSWVVRDASCDIHGTQYDMPAASALQTNSEYLMEMLGLLAENFQSNREAEEEVEMVSTELAQTYEELVLLHRLSTNMKVTEPDTNFLQMACDNLTAIVSVEGIAVLLEKIIENEKQLVVAAGSGLIDIDEQRAAILHSRLAEEIKSGKEALLDSEVDSAFRYDWSETIKNIIAVPLFGKDEGESHFAEGAQNGNRMIGLMVAINRIDKPDFDSTDVKLFNSVANGCAVFIENGRLFKDLKELFIGSLKALTSTIDAKDQYTRGHSERVAFISRWIGEKLAVEEGLEEEQIHKLYLAGLLHDIGKIGIEETVLCKNGKLTEQELNRIRMHPSIGAGILSEIKQMRDIVPAVLCHHERIDGQGYPNGLIGEDIPLTGKIVGLADCFDAMTSKRIYRDALTIEQAPSFF